jgi:protein MPE1
MMNPGGGPPYFAHKSQQKLPPGYVCKRCGFGGHFIKECPTNSDSTYDPY